MILMNVLGLRTEFPEVKGRRSGCMAGAIPRSGGTGCRSEDRPGHPPTFRHSGAPARHQSPGHPGRE